MMVALCERQGIFPVRENLKLADSVLIRQQNDETIREKVLKCLRNDKYEHGKVQDVALKNEKELYKRLKLVILTQVFA